MLVIGLQQSAVLAAALQVGLVQFAQGKGEQRQRPGRLADLFHQLIYQFFGFIKEHFLVGGADDDFPQFVQAEGGYDVAACLPPGREGRPFELRLKIGADAQDDAQIRKGVQPVNKLLLEGLPLGRVEALGDQFFVLVDHQDGFSIFPKLLFGVRQFGFQRNLGFLARAYDRQHLPAVASQLR